MARQRFRGAAVLLAGVLCLAIAGGRAAEAPPQQNPPAAKPSASGGQVQPQQQPPQTPQQPTFRTGINLVRVDVIVTDRDGRPITDLTQADFEVSEDGKPQTIDTFKLIEITGIPKPGDEAPRPIRDEADEEFEAARDDVRLFVIFLDDYHVRRSTSMAVRQPLASFVTMQLGSADMVGLMYPLTPVSDVRLIRDHDAIARAIGRFEGRKYDYTPRNDIEERYANYPAEVVEQVRNQVTLSALRGLVTHLGSLREGRKAVILVSEGFSNLLPPQMRDPIASMPGLGNPNRGQPLVGEGDPNEDRARFFSSVDLQNDLREVYDTANRNNTTIYALDPRGLGVFEFDINEGVGMSTDRTMLQSTIDTLRVLADQTDGRAIVNQNDLEAGLKQVIRDSSAYYLLGYNSARPPQDGKFHEIKVRVKRPGVQARSRKGYWAYTAEDMKRALAPPRPEPPAAIARALTSIAEPARGRLIRTWIGTARAENGRTRLTFVWEPLPPVPGSDRFRPSQVSLVAAVAGERPVYQGRVPENPAPPAPSGDVRADGTSTLPPPRVGSRVTFDVRPGALQLKISVHGTDIEIVDTEIRDVKIPDFTGPQVALSTPAVFRAANAREFQALRRDPEAIATATRDFRRTERLLIRIEAYGPGESNPVVTCRVLNRLGGGMTDVPVPPPASGTLHEIDLPLAGLVVGEYLVEIKAKGADSEATELVPLRIVP